MKLAALVPFAYGAATRYGSPRDFAYLVATQWIPGVWLVFRLGGTDPVAALALYAAGYLAFIALYEIGYLVNDTWDARRHPDARRRFPYELDALYIGAFIAVRLGVWLLLTVLYPPRFGEVNWLVLCGVLVVVFAIHNITHLTYLRIASFVQLCMIRFIAPVAYGVASDAFLTIMAICSLFYLHFRYLVYLESKGFLLLPQRKQPTFNFLQLAVFTPFVLLLTVVTRETVILEVFAYFSTLYAAYAILSRPMAE